MATKLMASTKSATWTHTHTHREHPMLRESLTHWIYTF